MYRPPLCSEREPGGYEDCTWCGAVMLNNAHHGRADVPSTRLEYEALRVAGGDGPAEKPGDGSNQQQAQTGIIRRYGWTPSRIGVPGLTRASFGQVWDRLDPGVGGSIQGSMGVFARSSHWRRWDPGFGGAHNVYVQRESTADRVWWMDPLAPKGYPGEWMSKADFRRYVEGLVGGYLFARVAAPRHVHAKYGGVRTDPFPDRTRADEPIVRVHSRPDTSDATVVGTLRENDLFEAFQVSNAKTNDLFAGSRTWYGDHHGRRWVHKSRLRRLGGST